MPIPVWRKTRGSDDPAGDAFVSKLMPNGSGLAFSTYLGGSRQDNARGIADQRQRTLLSYDVINDQLNSDGSFVVPTRESGNTERDWVALPVMVETALFSSELVITNWAGTASTLHFEYVADNIQNFR